MVEVKRYRIENLERIKQKVMIKYKKKAEDLAKELGIKINRDKDCYIYQTVYEILKQVEEEFIRDK